MKAKKAQEGLSTIWDWLFRDPDKLKRAEGQDWKMDDPQFHWSTGDVEAFNTPTASGKAGKAVYMSPNIQGGKRYLHADGNKQDVYKVDKDGNEYFPEGSNVMPLVYRGNLAPYGTMVKHAQDFLMSTKNATREQAFDHARDMLQKEGFTGVRVNDNEVAVFDPKNVRSPNAKFDPAKSESRNLLASNALQATGAGGLMAALAAAPDDAEASPAKVAKAVKDLLFLHNTEAYKLKRMQEMGGMPNPSMAVTQKDIPFDNFGDITLVADPTRFDPAKRGNPIFTGDAYTIRDPQPVRQAKKRAWEQLDKDYEGLVDPRDMGGVRSVLEQMERKGNMSSSYLDEVERFLQGYKGMTKYAKDKGIAWEPDKYGQMSYTTREKIIAQDPEGWERWVDSMMDRYLEPDKYFKDGKKLVPYTAENISKWKNKNAGVGQEDTMTYGTGNIFASDTKQLGSLDEIRANRDILQHPDKVRETKNWVDSQMDDLSESLRDSYEWDPNGFEYYNDVRRFYADTRKIGIDKAAKKHGFKNIPDNVREHLNWMNQESGTQFPAAYFESKPERVVDLSEFGGAIVPDDAPQGIFDLLKSKGVRVEKYSKADEASRTAARKKFQDYAFQVAPYAVGAPTATYMMAGSQDALASQDAPTKANANDMYNMFRAAQAEAEQLQAQQRDPLNPSMDGIERNPNAARNTIGAIGAGIEQAMHSLPHMMTPQGFGTFVAGSLGAPGAFEMLDKQIKQKAPDYKPKGEMSEEARTLWQLLGSMASPY